MKREKKYSVALADDHAILRTGLIYIVNSFTDFHVDIEAGSGDELLNKIAEAKRKPDICIMDVNMPGMNGYDTTKEIKKAWPSIGILALSMHHNEFSVIKMLRCGASGYLPKETGPVELEEALTAIIDGAIYYSDLVSEKTVAQASDSTLARSQKFTKAELDFLAYCCSDYTYKEIADKMGLSFRTIDWYRDRLFEKLKIKTRTGLAVFAFQIGVEPVA